MFAWPPHVTDVLGRVQVYVKGARFLLAIIAYKEVGGLKPAQCTKSHIRKHYLYYTCFICLYVLLQLHLSK